MVILFSNHTYKTATTGSFFAVLGIFIIFCKYAWDNDVPTYAFWRATVAKPDHDEDANTDGTVAEPVEEEVITSLKADDSGGVPAESRPCVTVPTDTEGASRWFGVC